jgi:hypothetical protein
MTIDDDVVMMDQDKNREENSSFVNLLMTNLESTRGDSILEIHVNLFPKEVDHFQHDANPENKDDKQKQSSTESQPEQTAEKYFITVDKKITLRELRMLIQPMARLPVNHFKIMRGGILAWRFEMKFDSGIFSNTLHKTCD